MIVYTSFLLLFIPAVFVCFFFLRYFSLSFIFNDIAGYFHGGFKTSIIVLVALLTGSLILAYFICKPFEKIIKRIQEENYEPTDSEKESCLAIYKRLNKVIITVDLLGFFVGQIVVTTLGIMSGRNQFDPLKHSLVVLQALSFGAIGAVIVINGLDARFSKFRAMLKIQSFEKISKIKISSVSNSILMTFIISLFFVSINLLTVIYGTFTNNEGVNAFKKGLFCILVSLLLSFISFYFIIYGLKNRMKDTNNALNQIACKGDLTQRINITVLDDFGQLTTSINTMIDKLSGMINELSLKTNDVSNSADIISDSVTSASSALIQMTDTLHKINDNSTNQNNLIHQADENILKLAASVENVKRRVAEQSDAVNNISSSITQMSANINSVTETAKKAEITSEALSTTTENGKQAIQNAISSMNQIHESSIEVKNMIRMIQEVARETNLLSMNAAIEAAHAGQFGAGFAVVASEVRNLAESSAKSARNVQESINEMAEKIEAGVDAINSAGDSFENIAKQVITNAEYVSNISSAMKEQNAGAIGTQKSTLAVVETVKAVNELAQEETADAEKVREFMKTVVQASESTMNAVSESFGASEHLKSSILMVEESAEGNKTSVNLIQQQMKQFSV